MVTYDQEEALEMADCILIINQGRIEQVGTPYEIYTGPANDFIADFIGDMIFFPAEVSTGGEVHVPATNMKISAELPLNTQILAAIRPSDIHVLESAK